MGVMEKNLGKAKLANLVKETEKNLFRANRQLKEASDLPKEIESIFENLALFEEASAKTQSLAKEFEKELKGKKIVGQARLLFSNLEKLKKGIDGFFENEARARLFIEKHRTERLYSFETGKAATKFAKQAMESFSIQKAVFKPRFIGTIDIEKTANALKLKAEGNGIVLKPKNLKAFVEYMSSKRLASNISLECDGLKLVWHDKKTLAVDAPQERLFRLDRLCEVLEGKSIEKHLSV